MVKDLNYFLNIIFEKLKNEILHDQIKKWHEDVKEMREKFGLSDTEIIERFMRLYE